MAKLVVLVLCAAAAGVLAEPPSSYLPPQARNAVAPSSQYGAPGFGGRGGSTSFHSQRNGAQSFSYNAQHGSSGSSQFRSAGHGTFGGSRSSFSGSRSSFSSSSSQLSQTYGAPAQSFGAPAQSFAAPSQSYGAPAASSFSAPSQSYGAPAASSFSAPSQSYGAPAASSFSAPSQSYGAPSSFSAGGHSNGNGFRQSSFSAGHGTFGSSSGSFGSSFGASSNSFGSSGNGFASGQSYSAPSAQYGPPSSQYGPPSSRYGAPFGKKMDDDLAEPANYEYNYQVQAGDDSGAEFGHQESRENEAAKGQYHVLLPDGRMQIVEYEADEEGFRPVIRYEETGAYPAARNGGYNTNNGYNAPQGPY